MSGKLLPAEKAARRVADAVLFEGYVLYPYRSTSAKNQLRWQFGMLGPVGALAAGVGEEPSMRTELLVEPTAVGDASGDTLGGAVRATPGGASASASSDTPGSEVRIGLTLRFLHPQYRSVEQASDGRPLFEPTPELVVGDARWVPWHEAVVCEVPIAPRSLAELAAGPVPVDVNVASDKETELLRDADGRIAGRLVRVRWPLAGRVTMTARPLDVGGRTLYAITVEVENVGRWDASRAGSAAGSRGEVRDIAARSSFAGTHLLARVAGGRFLSPVDPPEFAEPTVRALRHHRCWPVLAGAEGGPDDLALVSPIILSDRPTVAEESAGDFFDATEIDEMLTLRVMTLTDEEKAQARGTDPRAAAIIERCDTMSEESMARLHGVVRDGGVPQALSFDTEAFDTGTVTTEALDTNAFTTDAPWWDPASDASVSPEHDTVDVGGVRVGKGMRVRLRPTRRADAQDLFLVDRIATVAAVLHDVDGEVHVAVTLDDDPGRDLHAWYGRFYYFAPDELEPQAVEAAP